jgi:hypothetical protein
MKDIFCPKCKLHKVIKSGVVKGKQRYKCQSCNYHFSVMKDGKRIDPYYVIKALQLYIEGVTYREIERILGISHASVINWVKEYNIKAPENLDYRPTYRVLNHKELVDFVKDRESLLGTGSMITELGDKFMVIKWERFKRK